MISTKIPHEPAHDCYRALAFYVGAASHEQEKLLLRWHAGCASEEFDLAIREAEAVQDMNTRTTKEKTYHLMVSIRAEDESAVTPERWREIEEAFAQALGFEDHQRHCGVHKNTGHVHMHVAYNMIHPQTYNRHDPYFDYQKRDRVCRELERRFGLIVDVRQDQEQDQQAEAVPKRGNSKARTVEAHTGQQSFDGYMQELKSELAHALEATRSWNDLHTLCARHGVELKRRSGGCVFKDRHGKHAVKASSLGRQFSQGALEKRFGAFTPADASVKGVREERRYAARPLQRGAERGDLYKEYQTGIAYRKDTLGTIRQEKDDGEATIRKAWADKRAAIEKMSTLTARDRYSLLRKARMLEGQELDSLRRETETRRQEVRAAVPYWSWAGFLQMKAEAGDEMALAILRSRKEEIAPEASSPRPSEAPSSGKEATPSAMEALRERWRREREKIRERTDMTQVDKRSLLAVTRLSQLMEAERLNGGSSLKGTTWRVDAGGTVLFALPSGGLVRESAREISFSAHDPQARAVAEKMARLKFGRRYSLQQNKICRAAHQEQTKEQKRKQEMER